MNPVGQEEGRLGRRTESGRRRRSCPAALGEGRAATQGSRKLRAGARRASRRTALAGPWGWREAKGSALHRWGEGSCHRDLPPGTAPRSHHQHPRLDPARQSPLPPATSALLPSLSLVIEVTTPALPIHATLGHPLHPLWPQPVARPHAGLRGRTAFGARGRPFHSTPAAPRDMPDSPDGLAPVAPQRPPDGLHVRLELGQAGLLEESAVVGVLAGGGQAELGHCNESPRTGHLLGSPVQPAHPCGVRGWLHPPRPTPISTEWPV